MKKSILSKSDLKFLSERGLDEILASNTYRYASTCMQRQSLFGFEAFFRKEAKDELKPTPVLVPEYLKTRMAQLPLAQFSTPQPKPVTVIPTQP